MKNYLYSFLLCIVCGCNFFVSDKKEKDDSLAYYPPTPKQLSKKEFRRYFNQAKYYFDSTLLSRGFNGQLLIAKDGAIIFEQTMGYADMQTRDSLTSHTPLHVASTSKTFTAMAILHLQEMGSLNINDTLGRYFPEFPYQGITIKMLLSHRSGLPNYLNYLSDLKINDTCYSNNDVLNSLYNLKPNLESRPGTRFGYSNTNYVLLALIIERVTGEAFPAYIKKTFFDPLNMTNSFVYVSSDTLKPTPSFQWNGRLYPNDQFDCTYGDKNIYTTVEDLYKWDQALSGGKLFKKETLDSAYDPLSNEHRSIHNYGLGWRMMIFKNGKKLLYHNGRWHGSNAAFVRLPDENATIIAIGNRYNSNIYWSAMRAANLFGDYFPGNIPQVDEDEQETTAPETDKGIGMQSKSNKSSKTRG